MKKLLSIFLVFALVLSLTAPMIAEDETEPGSSGSETSDTELSFSYDYVEPDDGDSDGDDDGDGDGDGDGPLYTVDIPDNRTLGLGTNYLSVEAVLWDAIGDHTISVTIEGTQDTDDTLYSTRLWRDGVNDAFRIPYALYSMAYPYTEPAGAAGVKIPRTTLGAPVELARFTEDGSVDLKLFIDEDHLTALSFGSSQTVNYAGTITFGIKLVEHQYAPVALAAGVGLGYVWISCPCGASGTEYNEIAWYALGGAAFVPAHDHDYHATSLAESYGFGFVWLTCSLCDSGFADYDVEAWYALGGGDPDVGP